MSCMTAFVVPGIAALEPLWNSGIKHPLWSLLSSKNIISPHWDWFSMFTSWFCCFMHSVVALGLQTAKDLHLKASREIKCCIFTVIWANSCISWSRQLLHMVVISCWENQVLIDSSWSSDGCHGSGRGGWKVDSSCVVRITLPEELQTLVWGCENSLGFDLADIPRPPKGVTSVTQGGTHSSQSKGSKS